MIIHSPIISGSLTFAEGSSLTLPPSSVYSGSFSGSFQGDTFSGGYFSGDGSQLTFGGRNIVSSSAQTISNLGGSGVISSSIQISSLGAGIVSSSTQTVNHLGGTEIISSSAQTAARLINQDTDFGLGRVSGDNIGSVDGTTTFTGSFVGDGTNLSGVTSYTDSDTLAYINSIQVVSSSAQISSYGVFAELNGDGIISGSSQVDHDLTTNFVANEHIDHSTVSITAGAGLTGGGTIDATRTINVGAGEGITVNANDIALSGTYTGTWAVTGAITATGDITAYASSDERLKDNIEVISNPIEKVQQLKGVTWNWNDNASEVQQSLPNVGVIAQDVEKVLPQLVRENEGGYKAVDYDKLVGLLIEAIKDQQNQIDELKSKLS